MNSTTYEPGVLNYAGWSEADWTALLVRLERVYRTLGLAPDLAREATWADVTSLRPAADAVPAAL